MKLYQQVVDDQVQFVIAELDPIYHQAALDLAYTQTEDGFVRSYPANTPHLDQFFANFSRYTEAMLRQGAGLAAVPWEETLIRFIKIAEQHDIDWWLIGSGALAARGLDVQPGDIDISTSAADALRLGDLMIDTMVQPVQDTTGWVGKWFARAFLGSCFEWLGGVSDAADAYGVSDFGPVAVSRLEEISWRDHTLRVPPLELQLDVALRRGRQAHAEMIRQAIEHR